MGKTPDDWTARPVASSLSLPLPGPHAAINSRMTGRPFGPPAHQSFSFCLRSDFLILPGFIDFIADEVVRTSSFGSRRGLNSCSRAGCGRGFPRECAGAITLIVVGGTGTRGKGLRLMGQRHLGLGEILESLEWQPQKGLEDALSPKKLERRLRRGPVRRGVGSGSFII